MWRACGIWTCNEGEGHPGAGVKMYPGGGGELYPGGVEKMVPK